MGEEQVKAFRDLLRRSFQENLIKARAARGFTQEQLADASGVARTTIANYERGEFQNVELLTIFRLADSLEVRPEELVAVPAWDVPVEPLVAAYLARWREIDQPTDEELAFLRSRPSLFWVGWDPTPDSIHSAVEAYRKRQRKPTDR